MFNSKEKLTTIQVKAEDNKVIEVINQLLLPHQLKMEELKTWKEVEFAIKEMIIRGAPLIGVTASFGVYLASLEESSVPFLMKVIEQLREARPTAVNLMWAMDKMKSYVLDYSGTDISAYLLEKAMELRAHDIEVCKKIGEFALPLIEDIHQRTGNTVNILTHCNAGWLGCVDWGTATSPIYQAHEKGIPVHVYVDETRPRNQGFSLTAWELTQRGVPHTCIVDNTGGHLMQHKMIDICFVGTDRTTLNGDVANKIGTYLKALAAKDNGIPFYACVPISSIDFEMEDGVKNIPIEERSEKEVKYIQGLDREGKMREILLTPKDSKALNLGFDVTPARLITGIVTEKGIFEANVADISKIKSIN